MKFKNIIFDLGGVILNIDYDKTITAFKELGISNFEDLFTQARQEDLFNNYETGKVPTDLFVNRLLSKMPNHVNESNVVDAWNAMLLDLPMERLSLLKKINSKFNTALLSNTNELHLEAFHHKISVENDIKDLGPYFDKIYFSCDMGMRKPNTEIFLYVCDEQGYDLTETLFIDDSIQHVEGAKKAGLNAYHLKDKDLCDVFDKDLNFIG